MTTFALICARGGSTRVPQKNLADLGGRPLLAWPIAAAREAGIGRIVVSTDDPQIMACARQWDAHVVERPADLATATADMDDAIAHALDVLSLGYAASDDVCVVLSACSPFVEAASVRAAADLRGMRSAVGVADIDPHVAFEWLRGGAPAYPAPRPRTQELPRRIYETGGLYAFRVGDFDRAAGRPRTPTPVRFVELTRREALDIDTPEDLERARMVLTLDAVGAWRAAVDDTIGALDALVSAAENGAKEPTPNAASPYVLGYHDGLRAGRREAAHTAAAVSHALRRKGAV